MNPDRTKNSSKKIRGTVRNLALLRERWLRTNEHGHARHGHDVAETADYTAHERKRTHGADFRSQPRLLERHLCSGRTYYNDLVTNARNLTAHIEEFAVENCWCIIATDFDLAVKGVAKGGRLLLKSLVCGHVECGA